MPERRRQVDQHLGVAGRAAEDKTSLILQLLLRLRIMFAESPIPGLRVILGMSHPFRRLAWTVALTALVYIGLQDLYGVFREYFEYADTVDVQWSRPPEGITLPAVTFCNMNQVRRRAFCGDIDLNRSTTAEWQRKICKLNARPLPVWLREDDALEREQFAKWVTELQRRNQTTASLLGHQREDMVVSCLVGGKDCNSAEYLQLKVYGRYGNCYCLGCNVSAEAERIHTAYSVNQGIRLLLNLELNEYLSHSTEAGFVVNLHQPGVRVDFSDSVFLLPRRTTYISVTQSIYYRLEPPFRNPCQWDFPKKYRRLVSPDCLYTQEACRHICYQLRFISACNCQSHDFDTVDRTEADICDEDDESLNQCILDVTKKINDGKVKCPCLESCSYA
ncbi:acid-sensing ion channel 1C-like [Haemaphysalis longicornis]